MKVCLFERFNVRYLVGNRFRRRSTVITKDGRVYAIGKPRTPAVVREGTDPVIINRLICFKNERITLACEGWSANSS
jgi:hypothetical protein